MKKEIREFLFNLNKHKRGQVSITHLKRMYLSVVSDEIGTVQVRNVTTPIFQKVLQVNHKDVERWFGTLSRKYGFSYEIRNYDNKGNQIYYFEK